ncbi:MAG: FtsQ-type POTRA domain-containing protein [Clostridia bacterium]|nr:FtsQ-type POTRA domain-containing protein [Clostridia bacterium]
MAPNVKKIPRKPKKKRSSGVGAKRLRAAVCLIGLTLLFMGLTFVTHLLLARDTTPGAHDPYGRDTSETPGTFSIQSLTVVGNHHYTDDQILRASGLYVGQSVWALNKAQAEANIKDACPYVESVRVTSSLLSAVTVTVTETTIAGAMAHDGTWILVGANGQGVDTLPMESDLPPRYLYLKGATYSGNKLGQQAMDDRCTAIMTTILSAMESCGVTGIAEIDMTDKSSLTLNWNNQITVLLGNDSNLSYEIAVLAETLPKALKNHGKQARGVLDISSYSSDELTNQAIFTPDAG